jgi:NADH-quinone oxidoreductase subunit M
VLLAAIMLKLGSYGFVRISLPILPEEATRWAPAIAILAVIGIIYGSLACLAQTDMKRLIAFSSVGHMGFVMLGIATLTDVGINASIIGMVAHGLITGLLFFLAGSMSHRYHTREMSRLGGNIKLMPVMGGILAFTAMASLGLPGLAGFWGEFMSLIGSYNPLEGLSLGVFRTAMVLGAIGTVLTAATCSICSSRSIWVSRGRSGRGTSSTTSIASRPRPGSRSSFSSWSSASSPR